jgi:3-dehydroquinate synthase
MLEIPVELGLRRYTVSVGYGLSRALPELLGGIRGRRMVVVSGRRALGPLEVALVPDGERFKSASTLERLYEAFLAARLGRDGVVVAFGGGVVGDVAGYAAATYMRGVDWIGIPTTLLSMVDSSVGGKVGINHAAAKNLIGTFHQPRAVIADPAFLDTLAPREMRSGAYEILKCAILGDRALFSALAQAPPGLRGWDRVDIENAVATACRIKAEVVEKDEREGGMRRLLNLGHTLGHALEAVTRYRRFTHGEAVGWGLVGAGWIARHRGLLRESAWQAIASAVDHIGPRPGVSDLPETKVIEALGRDKKVRAGRTVLLLPTAIGRVVVRDDVTTAEVRHALRVMAGREALLD